MEKQINKIYKEIEEQELSFRKKNHIELNIKSIIRTSIKRIMQELERKRITDNADYISIPLDIWFKLKGENYRK